eukprot:TRINITY_DN4638_c0_g1_i3.p1 TRINITY_DN4638_c0_g1~~TRINITY_DN4638_c0_g1_i3.p1  ORF type:complete len:893 (-),score=49.75 TRINITY_DN4638_c0_g1_i3:449-2740(-)
MFCINLDVISAAKLSASALGLFQIFINGKRVGDREEFQPGFSEYTKRVYYRTYDVKDLLIDGINVWGAILGEGFYSGYVAFSRKKNFYGFPPKFIAELEIKLKNGQNLSIVTDENWKISTGPILWSDIYDGEQFDARFVLSGWTQPDYDTSLWYPVGAQELSNIDIQITLHPGPPIRKIMEIQPISMSEVRDGVYVFDMGQNIVGWVRLLGVGISGDMITIRYAEMLYEDGNMYTRNYRTAKNTDIYIFAGDSKEAHSEVWEPHFTYHGFRYVELSGFEMMRTRPNISWITGVVLHSDLQLTGTFECSEPLLNQLQSNILWSQRGNFFDIPTDCPQRDERMGWTGDAQVFAPTASFNMNVQIFFRKWLIDLVDSQKESGAVPPVAPNVLEGMFDGILDSASGWADAIVIIPYTVYLHYNDVTILQDTYPAMNKWIDYQVRTSIDLTRPEMGFGDWLGVVHSPSDMVGSAYFAHVTHIVAKIARILGHIQRADELDGLHRQIRQAFQDKFMQKAGNGGQLIYETQATYLLVLEFELTKDPGFARQRLLELIKDAGYHLTTGFLGTPLLLPALTKLGEVDMAYKLLLQRTHPSWLFPILQGATTMWERWNSYTKDSGFGPSEMNSFNHYAYGAVGAWMYANILGIELHPEHPGYKIVIISPKPGGGLTWAQGQLQTPYGLIQTKWEISQNTENQKVFTLEVKLGTDQEGIVKLEYFQSLTQQNIDIQYSREGQEGLPINDLKDGIPIAGGEQYQFSVYYYQQQQM